MPSMRAEGLGCDTRSRVKVDEFQDAKRAKEGLVLIWLMKVDRSALTACCFRSNSYAACVRAVGVTVDDRCPKMM